MSLRENKFLQAEELFAAYADSLYGYILTKIPDQDFAAQILRKSFVYAINHLSFYDSKRLKIFSWLIQIAVREIGEHYKQPLKTISVLIPVTIALAQ